jgi:hypothetical protein
MNLSKRDSIVVAEVEVVIVTTKTNASICYTF